MHNPVYKMESPLLQALLLFSLVLLSQQTIENTRAEILYSWRFPDFTYPSQEARQVAEQQQLYVPQNNVILDSDYYFSPTTSLKRVFVTTPQFRNGIPATVSEVSRERNGDAFLLKPFPSWDAQSQTTCEGPSSVYRINIDKCGLLWVIDTGRVNTFVSPRRACRPKLLIYDLNNNDALLERFEFPDGTINDRSNLITPVIESYQQDCRDSIAYIADVNAYGLVVYDWARRTSWRVENNFFYPFPHKGTMTVQGVTYDLMDGVFGLALSPPTDTERKLFFHAFASVRESWVPLRAIKNTTLVANAAELRSQFYISDDVREGQSSLEVMTDDGILIYTLINKNAIACWNSGTPFKKENQHILYQNDETLQFISGMKLKGDHLLITSSRLQNYINGVTDTNDIKYRLIIIESVLQLLKGSPCLKKSGYSSSQQSSTGTGRPQNKPSTSGGSRPSYNPSNSYATSRRGHHTVD